MRSVLRAADAKFEGGGEADGFVGAESEFDGAFKVRGEVDVTAFAVDFRLEGAEFGGGAFGGAAEGAEDVPAEVEEAGAGGAEEEFEDGFAVGLPVVGEFVGAQAGGDEVVGLFEGFDEPGDEDGVSAGVEEVGLVGEEPRPSAWGEAGFAEGAEGGLSGFDHAVVFEEGSAKGAAEDEADLKGDAEDAENVSGGGPDLVGEVGAAARAGFQVGLDAEGGHDAFGVFAGDAEAAGVSPFEGVLFVFKREAVFGEADFEVGVTAGIFVEDLEGGGAGVAVEAVGVGDERPEVFGGGLEVPFPLVVDFLVRHGFFSWFYERRSLTGNLLS